MVKWIIVILLFLLSLRLFLFYQLRDEYREGEEVVFDALLLTEPIAQGRLQRFWVRMPNGQRIFITASVHPLYHYGQQLAITGTIQKSQRGASFLSFPSVISSSNQKFSESVFSFLGGIRTHIMTFFQGILPPTSAGLLLGIVFGIREQIPSEFTSALRSSGVLHVVAASGMNVSIVVSMLAAVSIKFIKRQYAVLVIIPAVLFYAFLAGLDPPIVRACVMAVLAITASLFGRQYFGLLALALTACVMLFIWPYLLFDIGFQLSFLATLGILIVKPLLPFHSVQKAVLLPMEDIRTTVAAQITTVPILLFSFGQYGMLSLLANAFTLWMVPILMVLGLVAAVASFIVSPLAQGLVLLALPLLLLFETVVFFVGGLHADVSFSVPPAMVLGYYLLLGAVALLLYKRKTLSA